MPIRFRIDPTQGIVAYTVEGEATAADARAFLDAVQADPEFRRGFGFVGDRRRAFGPTAEYIGSVAGEVRARARELAPCRWAVVVGSEEAAGVVRVWEMLTDRTGVKIAPFMSPDRAAVWAACPS